MVLGFTYIINESVPDHRSRDIIYSLYGDLLPTAVDL